MVFLHSFITCCLEWILRDASFPNILHITLSSIITNFTSLQQSLGMFLTGLSLLLVKLELGRKLLKGSCTFLFVGEKIDRVLC